MGDDSETQSQVGWLMEVIVCVSLKLSPAIGADTGRSDYFTQANNCSLAVGRILHYHILAQCRCLNFVLSFNISNNSMFILVSTANDNVCVCDDLSTITTM